VVIVLLLTELDAPYRDSGLVRCDFTFRMVEYRGAIGQEIPLSLVLLVGSLKRLAAFSHLVGKEIIIEKQTSRFCPTRPMYSSRYPRLLCAHSRHS
jgi:hypothetical protein